MPTLHSRTAHSFHTVRTLTVPSAPTGLAATAGDTQVSLTWDLDPAVLTYNVYQGTSPGGESGTPVQTGLTSAAATVTGLTNNTHYYFKVAGVNAAGVGSLSSEAGATPTTSTATYPSSAATITTPQDTVPNFAQTPTINSNGSGLWSATGTWDLNRVPIAGDIVGIKTTHTVTYDVVSTAAIVAVGVAGTLQFSTSVDTKLTCQHLLVYGTEVQATQGHLKIGTSGTPVSASVTAEIVISDVAINTGSVGSPGPDPSQYGNGLLVWGQITTFGATKTPFVRLSSDITATDTTLGLSSAVSGWRVGDVLCVPDCRQLQWETQPEHPSGLYVNQTERLTINTIAGNGLSLTTTAGAAFGHVGVKDGDGTTMYRAHIGNLTRNVIIRSANPTGTRGHTIYFHRAMLNIQNTQYHELGRSTNAPMDNATFSGSTLTHVGTNQKGRYPVHLHHVYGPAGGSYPQYTFKGNTITSHLDNTTVHDFKWGMSIHDTHYGLIQNNVIYNWAGWGFGLEDGGETENVIDNNFICYVHFTPNGELQANENFGNVGAGMWMHGYNNHVTNNVIADTHKGLDYWALDAAAVNIPNAPGSDTTVLGQYMTVNMLTDMGILECDGNEVYGGLTATATTIYNMGSDGDPTHPDVDFAGGTISNHVVWHVYDKAYYNYKTVNLTFDNWTVLNDWSHLRAGIGGTIGLYSGDYIQDQFTVINSRIEGHQVGIDIGAVMDIGFGCLIQDTAIRCYTGVSWYPMYTQLPPDTIPGFPTRRVTTLRNVTFTYDGATGDHISAWGSPQLFIFADASPHLHFSSLIYDDQFYVYDHQGVSGDDFRLYCPEAAGSAILTQTSRYGDGTIIFLGSPDAGKTNTQNLADNGICFGDAIPPGGTTTRTHVHGLCEDL